MRRLRLSAVLLAGLLGPLARAHARSAPPNPYPGYMSTTYSDPAHWLCRPDLDIAGDLTPEWGMHVIDVNVAMGDLLRIAHDQAKAFQLRRHRGS